MPAALVTPQARHDECAGTQHGVADVGDQLRRHDRRHHHGDGHGGHLAHAATAGLGCGGGLGGGGVADGLVGIVGAEGVGGVVEVGHLGREGQDLARRQGLRAVQTIGLGDHPPQRRVAPDRGGDRLQRIARAHRHLPRADRQAVRMHRIVGLGKVLLRAARHRPVLERPLGPKLALPAVLDPGDVIGLARPVVGQVLSRLKDSDKATG